MGHDHGHGTANPRRLAVALAVTAGILIAEVIGAVLTGSLALLTDAGHMLTDVLGLTVALIAARLMQRPASNRRTWGFLRAEVLAAGAQATILLGVGVYAIVEGIRRLLAPEPVAPLPVLIFGIVGLAGNLGSMLVLTAGRKDNLNMRAAFYEVVVDALGSVAVVVSALVVTLTGWQRADPIAGLLIAVLILPRAVIILREAGSVLLESTPPGLDLDTVRRHILEVDQVVGLHDVHASRISTDLPVLSAHVVVADEAFRSGELPVILDRLQQCLSGHFDVEHSTFQFEPQTHIAHEHTHG